MNTELDGRERQIQTELSAREMSVPGQVVGSSDERLLADIGGTNARFAWQSGAGGLIHDMVSLPCAAYSTLAEAIQHYLVMERRPTPLHCAIAIANPVLGDLVQMTNHHWSFSVSALKRQFGFSTLRVLNDFTALALALPTLQPTELKQIGGQSPVAHSAIGLIGPGTGLGMSGLLPDGRGQWIPMEGEGGHATLPACNAREHAVLQCLGRRYGHVSAERALCGQGLVDIHHALQEIDGTDSVIDLKAANVVSKALAGEDSLAIETINLFCAFLGTVAGNLALTLGARGGIYIGGGMVPRFASVLEASTFRQSFEAKGRFNSYLSVLPVYVIQTAQSPALRGASLALNAAQAMTV